MSDDSLITATAIARAALPAFGLPANLELELLKHRENVVFSVNVPAADPDANATILVLRVHRRGYHSDAELSCELDFVSALERQGVPVPSFLRTLAGEGFTVVGTNEPFGAHQVDLQRLIVNSGNFGDERTAVAGTAEIDPSDFHEIGRLIANLHAATERSGYQMAFPRDDWDLEGLIGSAPAWGDPLRISELQGTDRDAVTLAIALARNQLENYGTPSHRFGAIHADLTPENVLRTSEGLVIIDFDDFAAGWHLFDLATALYFFTPHPRRSEYQSALFAGYEEIRPLDDADHAAFPAMLFARGLTYLGWSADRRGEPTAEWHAATVLPHIITMANALIQESA